MTVCVAAICENTIFGASDRMITSADTQFQPSMPKTIPLTSSIVVMTSGDAALLTEVLTRVAADIAGCIEVAPTEWIQVRYAADRFALHWSAIRRERAERALLWPLGLTTEGFLDRQVRMDGKLVHELADAILKFSVPSTSCIIAGNDATGHHLFQVDDGNLIQLDSVGFATCGSGGRHAASQLMLAQYNRRASMSEGLLLVYSAKRRAEIAPFVGRETDFWMIGQQLGSFMFVTAPHTLQALDTQFRKLVRSEGKAMDNAKKGIDKYLQKLVEQSAASNQTTIEQAS
jgi:20S proteasome alpha/beta subunit